MTTVTLSPKYQVVIPKQIRERLGLRVGGRIQAFAFEGRIELVPIRPMADLRGMARGIDTSVPPDPEPA